MTVVVGGLAFSFGTKKRTRVIEIPPPLREVRLDCYSYAAM